MCKILYSSRFAGCSYLMFFRLVVVPHMDSRAWMIYGRLSLHKMFGTNPVVIPVSYLSGNRPQESCTVLTCTMAIMRNAKTPSSISAADMYCYCSQKLHKSSFRYVKILVPAIFLSQNTTIVEKHNSKQLERSIFYPDSFPVARNFVNDRWNSEPAYLVNW